jgi:hypothetical protein
MDVRVLKHTARRRVEGPAGRARGDGAQLPDRRGARAASLTPVLIQQQYLARWDGRLPQDTFGGNAVPFVQLPGASGR